MLNKLLDSSVYFSFDKTGFKRHSKHYEAIDPKVFDNKNIIITGGTSGIGEALAKRLASSNCEITVTGRNKEKFLKSSLSKLSNVKFYNLDLAHFSNVREFANSLDHIDYLVCNAGGMPNKANIINDKFDTIFASQVVGHYILIEKFVGKK
jgi:dehydrogenase/reductase SDR family protein 12